jgi:hypothetical protein
MIHVKALKTGFYGERRIATGKVFQIKEEKEFSSKWMEKVEPKKSKAPKKQVEPEPEHTESEEI